MPQEASGGLFSSLKTLASTLLGMVHTRIELISSEIDEEIDRLTALFVSAAVSLFFLGLGVIAASVFLVVAFWDSSRLLVLGLLATVFIAVGVFFGLAFRTGMKEKPRVFESTLAELKNDRSQLQ